MDHFNGGNITVFNHFSLQQRLHFPSILFFSSYETGNGISAEAQGVLKNAGTQEGEAQEVSGSYAYTADDGSQIRVSYIANEHGYQPTGDGIPTVPPAIQRALDWIAAHPEPEDKPSK